MENLLFEIEVGGLRTTRMLWMLYEWINGQRLTRELLHSDAELEAIIDQLCKRLNMGEMEVALLSIVATEKRAKLKKVAETMQIPQNNLADYKHYLIVTDDDEFTFDCAYMENQRISVVIVDEGVTTIGASAFRGCRNLRKVVLPEGLKYIESHAFFECSALEQINLPKSLVAIEQQAFDGCNKLEFLRKPIYSSDKKILLYVPKHVKQFTIPDTVEVIGMYAFDCCWDLKKVVIPPTVRVIGERAFGYCMALRKMVVPGTVKRIYEFAFFKCGLSSLVLEEGVRMAGYGIVQGNRWLEEITLPSTLEDFTPAFGEDWKPDHLTLIVPKGDADRLSKSLKDEEINYTLVNLGTGT